MGVRGNHVLHQNGNISFETQSEYIQNEENIFLGSLMLFQPASLVSAIFSRREDQIQSNSLKGSDAGPPACKEWEPRLGQLSLKPGLNNKHKGPKLPSDWLHQSKHRTEKTYQSNDLTCTIAFNIGIGTAICA